MEENIAEVINSEKIINLRTIVCELNVLSRSDGSAILTQGQTAVMVSLYGPVEVKLQNLLVDKATVEVNFIPKSGISGVADRLKENVIRNTMEAAIISTIHPRSAININILEMQDRGGLLSCAINASCLALLSSGIEMKSLVAAVHCISEKENHIIIDPHDKQIPKTAHVSFMFVFDSVRKKMITSYTVGKFTQVQYRQCLDQCRLSSSEIFKYYREIVKRNALIL